MATSSSSSRAPVQCLITIPCSHFCEKSRWTLDWYGIPFIEEGHAPGGHIFATRSVGGSSVPVLVDVDGEVVKDSTDIITWAASSSSSSSSSSTSSSTSTPTSTSLLSSDSSQASSPSSPSPSPSSSPSLPSLLPLDPSLLASALALEDLFDTVLGPATRVVAYHHILGDKSLAMALISPNDLVPTWERWGLILGFGFLAEKMKKGMNINERTCVESLKKIDEIFQKVEDILEGREEEEGKEGEKKEKEKRKYLVGDSFSVADLTFASLASPVLIPPEMSLYHRVLSSSSSSSVSSSRVPPEFLAIVEKYRGTVAGKFALRLFAEDRKK